MDILMLKGSTGTDVDKLRAALATALGDEATGFSSLGKPGTPIDDDFDAAIKRWQAGVGIIADGVVGPRCQILLELIPEVGGSLSLPLTVGKVSQVFPATKPANIARYLPYIGSALGVAHLTDPAMILGALGTIRAETEGFVPISEFQSKYNTAPGGAPYALYDLRKDIGNGAAGDGAKYKGRGFVQLTGKANYIKYGKDVGLQLEAMPDMANAPEIAAVLLALFLQDKATAFRAAVAKKDYKAARKLVNGGAHGLENFTDVFQRAQPVWKEELTIAAASGIPAGKPGAAARRAVASATKALAARVDHPRKSKDSLTRKDAADIRDRLYMPPAVSLPDVYPPLDQFHFLPSYTKANLILAQGREGSCTGFGLTCVINYMRWIKAKTPPAMTSVSPRMLYTLARRHDEYEGENYEGSTCRGAIKGWFNHGVCLEPDWPYAAGKATAPKYGFAKRAANITLGVYYRIDTSSITDLQAAISQHGAIFVSAYTHDGWDTVAAVGVPSDHSRVPVIQFDGRKSETGGHAFAFVGYNDQGFILQNSWGTGFGAGGFAVLSYLDWLANAMDAWVVSLGVPRVIAGQLAAGGSTGVEVGRSGADRSKWWDNSLAYQHSVVLGNDGRVSRYLTEDEQPRKLQQQAYVLPDAWFRERGVQRKRLVLYVHGGLNDEATAIKRASAMGRYFIGNGCYPIFLVWKTGLLESLTDIITDMFRKQPAVAGAPGWVTDASDLVIEKTIARPGAKPIWSEMKENAELAFVERRGGDLLLDALSSLAGTWGDDFELHLVGHSAGSIAIGHLLKALALRRDGGRDQGLWKCLTSISLFAPACSVAFANRTYAKNQDVMQRLHLDILADKIERDDNVAAIYRKSLLYLVSNALEADVHAPILGLDRVADPNDTGWDGTSDTGDALKTWRQAAEDSDLGNRTTKVTASQVKTAIDANGKPVMTPAAHGSFDNDIDVVSRTMLRITGDAKLAMPIDDLRGF
ncbi:C1 family peptidase [Variovorax sp. J2P1-59]|uniref:C1 family peptidase n=1 Tax=Variovorax flavidus TaxID=3053501 RepID=UPI002578C6FE|nr:C1 family peptidase [Variovorax sp. J2P1-59]MDM0073416.1 C1 family peptidase [Variovorax sp. J2P1-59]